MHHNLNDVEESILANIDFVIPLKQVGLITRAVLEGVSLFYSPRRIFIITSPEEIELIKELSHKWNVSKLEFIDETLFFMNGFGLNRASLLQEYDVSKEGNTREAGWWLQQIYKFGCASQITGLSDVYVVWDGDLIPLRRWKLCELDSQGNINYYVAILQGEARSTFNSNEYTNCMRSICGFEPVNPKQGGTFVTHHMVFHKKHVLELIEMIVKRNNIKFPWPLYLMSLSKRFYRFSEYLTYSSYLSYFHNSNFHYHEFQYFGYGGLRFRDPGEIISNLLCYLSGSVHNSGISYCQIREFVSCKWMQYSTDSVSPAYIQLDHVYGMNGSCDINTNERQSDTTIESISDSSIPDMCSDYFTLPS